MRATIVSVIAIATCLAAGCSSSSGADGTTDGTDSGHPGSDSSTHADTAVGTDVASADDTATGGTDTKTGGGDTATGSDVAKSDGSTVVDAGADAHPCGKPGDTGNPLGVGKYCAGILDCIGNGSATICSSIGDATTHFCTMSCTKPAAGAADPCGTGASCQCDTGGCGCTPNSCL